MTSLQVQLFGGFHLTHDQKPIATIHQARRQSLLAYLLLHRHHPQPRQRLAFLFWPDSTETQARTNLRRALYHIRRGLPDADRFVRSDAHTVQWAPDAPFTLDVADFAHALSLADAARQRAQPAAVVAHLTKAVDLYRGELLPDCYDDWILTERERLHQRVLAALEWLMQHLEETRAYAPAIRYGQRLLALDPIHEATYRRLMRLHALNNDRAGALRVYHTCADILQRELGVTPNADTQEVYARLLHADTSPRSPAPFQLRVDTARLVGRQAEWQQLWAAWRIATEIAPHFVLVAGEAGIGKSHLVAQMQQGAAQQGITIAHARAYAAESRLAYAPVVEWLRSDPWQANLDQLNPLWLSEVARLLPELFEAHPDLPRPGPLTERWQRQRLFEALTRALLLAKSPLLLALDDLQWCDPETLEWLHFLLRSTQESTGQNETPARLLVVGTVRPEEIDEQHPLMRLRLDLARAGQMTEIELGPLTADETVTLAAQTAERELGEHVQQRLYRASGGNPLFVVEMVRAGGWEEENAEQWGSTVQQMPVADSPALPPKVQAVIQSRLAQLSPAARKLANLAATIGRAFTFDVLAQASAVDEDDLVQGLDELWQRRIVQAQGVTAYDFSHDRIRDVAYAEISPVQRWFYHRRVAEALALLHARDVDGISAQLGWHWEQAQQPEEAVAHYLLAVDSSVALYAIENALFYLERILALLAELPATAAHKQQQLEILLKKADILIITKGWTHIERQQALEQANRLAKEVNIDHLSYEALSALRSYYTNTGEQYTGFRLAQEMLLLAEKTQEQTLLCSAYCIVAFSDLIQGSCDSSLHYYNRAQAMADKLGIYYWQIKQHARVPEILWICGYPDQARNAAAENIRLVDQQGDLFGRGHKREPAMFVQQRIGDPAASQRLAAEIIELSERFGFPNYAFAAQLIAGWAVAQTGAKEEGLRQIVQSLAAMEQIKDRFYRPYFLSLLAEVQAQSGYVADALDTLAQAQETVVSSGDRSWEAELIRLTGDFRLRRDPDDAEAETIYASALALARQQGARMLELRAAISLARLWQSQGKATAAYALLAPIYGWFDEGFDTPDLRTGRALLDELHTQASV